MNLHHLFAISRSRFPGKLALTFKAEGEPGYGLTYDELLGQAAELAAGLKAWGLKPGDRVAFYLGNRPELVVVYLALLRLGAVMVPINLAYRRREIAHILGDSEPRLILTERSERAVLDELEPGERSSVEELLLAEELEPWRGQASERPRQLVGADDPALIMYTSGTTGQSKGAVLTHGNVISTVTALLAAWAWRPDDVLLLTLPLFHTHGLVVGLQSALAAGATVRLRRRFDAVRAVDELDEGTVTLFFGVPTMYLRLVAELERRSEAPDLESMRLFCSGSAPLAAETFAEFERLTSHQILERYGMTETGMLLSNPYAGARLPGTVGTALPGVSARIVDEQGAEVHAGSEGELLVAGGNVFDRYWRAPEKTAESFSHDEVGRRWFHTRDLARQDPATGHVTLLGRRHELIISGGYNIYPREIEEILVGFAGIQEAAVVGRPHPEWGEVPVAFLVVEGDLDEEALEDYCRGELAAFKVPKTVRRVESLPRNALGKVQKHLLPD